MTGRRLLVVEDQAEIADMLALFFAGRGYETTLAPTGELALQFGRRTLPNLILLDVGLPDTDGYTLFKEFRSSARLRYTPIIFLTKRNKKAERLAGLELGANDYVTKPFDLEELYLRVHNAVDRASRESLTDPRTGLPSATIVRQELALLPAHVPEPPGDASEPRALEFRLRHLEPFLERYGPLALTELLHYTALLLSGVLNDCGDGDEFLGQSGDDSFTVICAGGRAEAIRAAALKRFNDHAAQHYGPGQPLPEGIRVEAAGGQSQVLPIVRLDAGPVGD